MKALKIISVLLCAAMFFTGCGKSEKAEKTVYRTEQIKLSSATEAKGYSVDIRQYDSLNDRISKMDVIAENGGAKLYFDYETCDIALEKGNSLYVSTPWDLSQDTKSTEAQKKTIASQIRLTYMDHLQKMGEISSFAQCVAKGQYTTQSFKDGIQVNMVIGRAEQRLLLPTALSVESFEAVAEALEGRAVSRIKAFYRLYDAETTSKSQIDLIAEKYPIVKEKPIYVLKEISNKEKNEIENYFKDAGYTFEQMDKDLEEIGAAEKEAIEPRFEISVRYSLENGELKVSVPTEYIKFDDKHFSLLEIGVLEYMASAICQQEGYVFLPDGCGALIGFNKDGNKTGNEIKIPVYGYDRSLTYTSGNDNLMTAALPVFGIKSQNGCLFCMIEQGDALAYITATSGGNTTGYSRAGASFVYSAYDSFEYKDVNTLYSWSLADKNLYTGEYTLRFSLMEGKNPGYSEMAAYYREKINWNSKNSEESTFSLMTGLYGSIKHREEVLFVPVNRPVALTKFDDAVILADDLKKSGIEELSLRYIGWQPGGLETRAFNKASVEGTLGGKRELLKLKNFAKKNGIGLFMDADLMYVMSPTAFDGFSPSADTARMLDKTYAGYNAVSLSSGLMNSNKFKFALRPSVSLEFFKVFDSKYKKLGIEGLSLGSIGGNLNGDKDAKRGINRQSAMEKIEELLKESSQSYNTVACGANGYVLPYVSCLIDLPSASSGYPDADCSVPFLQMVLHGKVSYTTPAVNLSGDYKTELLKAAENGASLYFELVYRNSEILKDTSFADKYSVDYNTWKDVIVKSYNELKAVLSDLEKETIVSHTTIQDGFVKVVYSSGDTVYVNYNSHECFDANIKVEAKSFICVNKGV